MAVTHRFHHNKKAAPETFLFGVKSGSLFFYQVIKAFHKDAQLLSCHFTTQGKIPVFVAENDTVRNRPFDSLVRPGCRKIYPVIF